MFNPRNFQAQFNADKMPTQLSPAELVAVRNSYPATSRDALARLLPRYQLAAVVPIAKMAEQAASQPAADRSAGMGKILHLFPEQQELAASETQLTAATQTEQSVMQEQIAQPVTPHISAVSTPIQFPTREAIIAAASDAIKQAPSELNANDEEARWRKVDELLESVFSYEPMEPNFPHDENFLDEEAA